MLLKELGGTCTIPCVSLCLGMVPSMAEVLQFNANWALDVEHRDGLVCLCAGSNFPIRAAVCPCMWVLCFEPSLLRLPEEQGRQQMGM